MWLDHPKSLVKATERAARRRLLGRPHVRPLVDYVATLRALGRGEVPDFDPLDGGVEARLLFLLQNPGPKAVESGFISRNNNDQTAMNMFEMLREAEVPRNETLLWNVVPWFASINVTREEVLQGARELERLINMLPRLRAMIFVGRKAQRAMEHVPTRVGVVRFECFHPSPKVTARYPHYRGLILETFRTARAMAGG